MVDSACGGVVVHMIPNVGQIAGGAVALRLKKNSGALRAPEPKASTNGAYFSIMFKAEPALNHEICCAL